MAIVTALAFVVFLLLAVPVAFTVGSFESVRGSLPLPEGLIARQAAINLLDRPEGKLLGMRVMQVK